MYTTRILQLDDRKAETDGNFIAPNLGGSGECDEPSIQSLSIVHSHEKYNDSAFEKNLIFESDPTLNSELNWCQGTLQLQPRASQTQKMFDESLSVHDDMMTSASSNASTSTSLCSSIHSIESDQDSTTHELCNYEHVLTESKLQASLAEITAHEMRQVLDWWRTFSPRDPMRDQSNDLPGNALASHEDWYQQPTDPTTARTNSQLSMQMQAVATPSNNLEHAIISAHEDALAQSFLVDQVIERTREMELIVQAELSLKTSDSECANTSSCVLHEWKSSSQTDVTSHSVVISSFRLVIAASVLYMTLLAAPPDVMQLILQWAMTIYLSQCLSTCSLFVPYLFAIRSASNLSLLVLISYCSWTLFSFAATGEGTHVDL